MKNFRSALLLSCLAVCFLAPSVFAASEAIPVELGNLLGSSAFLDAARAANSAAASKGAQISYDTLEAGAADRATSHSITRITLSGWRQTGFFTADAVPLGEIVVNYFYPQDAQIIESAEFVPVP